MCYTGNCLMVAALLILEAKDVSANINRTQAAERTEKWRFLSLVTLTFDLELQTRPSEGPTRLPCECGANPFSGSRDISCTSRKTRLTAPKTEPSAVHCVR